MIMGGGQGYFWLPMMSRSMSAYFSSISLRGCANWMRLQAKEEMDHALKLFDYILDRGGKAKVSIVDAPPSEWESPLAAFEAALHHEKLVTGWINELVDLAVI